MMLQSVFFYNSWWDILMMFFIGIALLRTGFIEGKKSALLYLAIAVTGIGLGTLLNYYQLRIEYNNRFDGLAITQQQTWSYYEIRRVLQTLGYLSLLILLYKAIPFQKVLKYLRLLVKWHLPITSANL